VLMKFSFKYHDNLLNQFAQQKKSRIEEFIACAYRRCFYFYYRKREIIKIDIQPFAIITYILLNIIYVMRHSNIVSKAALYAP
jgi:hypothetical protein